MAAKLTRWGGAWVAALLVLGGMAEAAGLLGSGANRIAMMALIVVGLAWALRGTMRKRKVAELYLWLAFILPYGPLNTLSRSLAAQLERDHVTLYAAVSIIHLALVCAALAVLGAWRSERVLPIYALARYAAALLIVGAVIFWSGATTFPGIELQEIAGQLRGHLWTSGTFLLATVITMAGLFLLTLALRDAGDRVASGLGLIAYLFGATFWTIHLAFRLTVMPWAAREFTRAGVPDWYEPFRLWSGLMFALYSVLAYAAIAAYGVALLRTRVLARWVGWMCIGFAVLGAPSFGPPLAIHLMPWILGILILQDRGARIAERSEPRVVEAAQL